MKNKTLTLITVMALLLIGSFTKAQYVSLEWAGQMGGINWDQVNSITVDDFNNIYITGYFMGTVDFDPGEDTYNIISIGNNDIFIQKLDDSGNLVWVKQMGGTENDYGLSVSVDELGNIYTVGGFEGTVDFDPGDDTLNLSSIGSHDIFVQKLDDSGNLVWVKQMGGTGYDTGWSIAVDNLENIYMTGGFVGTVDFDPGDDTLNLSSAGLLDIFVQKLDASGNLIWVQQMGGTDDDEGYSTAVDKLGNIFTTGRFKGTVDFDPGPDTYYLSSLDHYDIFIQKLNAAGDLVWVVQMGGIGPDWGLGIKADKFGNIYTTGIFFGTVDFNPKDGILNLSSVGQSDIFVQKLDHSGNLIWVRQTGGISSDFSTYITLDVKGNIYTTGYFEETVDFDPGNGEFNLSSFGGWDIYVQKLDTAGNFLWAVQMGGTGYDSGWSIAVDNLENIYTAGSFEGTSDFDPGLEAYNLTSAGESDIFVLKLADFSIDVDELENDLGIQIYPNPTSAILQIDKGNNQELKIRVFDNAGQAIISKTSFDQITELDFSQYASGIFYLNISNRENSAIKKVVKH